ncbi:TRAP transporter small permease subunit [Sulfurospirillum sp. 1307]|jgi:TRAP-type C4-dicarboxylate transport system permease small subunit
MRLLEILSDRLSKLGAYIASVIFIMLVGLIMTEIIGRSFFDYSTMLADEYSGYLYLAAVFFGLGYTFSQDGHIRISILTSKLSENGRKKIDFFAGILNSGVLIFALYYSFKFMMDSKEMEMVSENVSETPLWLTQIPMSIGLGIFILVSIVWTIKRISNDS